MPINDVTVTIASVGRYYKIGSLNVQWKLGTRSTATLVIEDPTGAYVPVVGNPIVIARSSVSIFGGSIDEVETRHPLGTLGLLSHSLRCVSYESRLDKRFIQTEAWGRVPFIANPGSNIITIDSDVWMQNGYPVQVKTDGTLPGGVSLATTYYLVNKSGLTYQLSLTKGGSPITITSAGTGEHRLIWMAGAIAAVLVGLYITGESIIAGTISDGAPVDLLTSDCTSISELFSKLAEISGYLWWIDPTLHLQFVPRSAVSAPFSITETSAIRNRTLRVTREDYANSILLKISPDAYFYTLVALTCDSVVKRWRLANAIESVYKVTVSGIEKSVGQYGIDTGMDFYFTPGDYYLYQDASGTPPAAGTLYIWYRPVAWATMTANDLTEQSARQAIEGGSGIYQRVYDRTDIINTAIGQILADALLAEYKVLALEFRYQTELTGLAVGQLQGVVLSYPPVSAYFLCDELRAFDDNGLIRYEMTAISGTKLNRYFEGFQKFLSGGGGSSAGAISGGPIVVAGTGIFSFSATMTANTSVASPVGSLVNGNLLFLHLTTDGLGAWQPLWSADFSVGSPAVEPPVMPSVTGTVIVAHYIFKCVNLKWEVVSAPVYR